MEQINFQILFRQAYDLYKSGKHGKAIEIFDQELIVKKNVFEIYQKTKCFSFNLKKYDEAIEIFDSILKINPKDSEILARKGYALEVLSRYNYALKCFDKALEIDPKNITAIRHKGTLFLNIEKYDEAIEIFDSILKINPKDSEILYNKAYALERIGRNDDSAAYYFKAFGLNTNDFDSLQSLGFLLIHYLGDNKSIDISTLKSNSENIVTNTAKQMLENEKKIHGLYEKYLFRKADPEGLFYFQRHLLGGKSFEWLENELKTSEEAQSAQKGKELEPKIIILYKKYLRREPDLAGMNYFKKAILDGKSFEWLENELKTSEEAKRMLSY